MDRNQLVIRSYFKKLGFEPEIASIYLALNAHGAMQIAELARQSGVERTRIYRLLEQLTQTGIIEVEAHYKRNIYKAAPISNLRILLSKKEQELKSLQLDLQAVETLLTHDSISSPATRVQFYRGADGVKQMFWNETKAATEVLTILHHNMQIKTKGVFFERWVERFNERGIKARGILSDAFIESQKAWYAKYNTERIKSWEPRWISPDIFPITHGLLIYDNVVAYFNWKNDEVFGIEMYNQQIADSQRTFYNMLWQQAMPVDDLTGKR